MNNGAAYADAARLRETIAALYNASGRFKEWMTPAKLKPKKPRTQDERRKAFEDYWASKPEASN